MLDSRYCEGDFVHLLAVVVEVKELYMFKYADVLHLKLFVWVQVGPILDFKVKDRKACRQEVKFVDQSDKETYIKLVLWDPVSQVFTLEWKAGATGNIAELHTSADRNYIHFSFFSCPVD